MSEESLKKSICVIIPYYNGSKWIERALISVFNQTVLADEVLVVNDGSTPKETEALYILAKQYPFTLLEKENGGQGSARNVGVAASTSQYICFLDQDDFYLPHHNEALRAAIPSEDKNFGFVYGDLIHANEAGETVHPTILQQQPGLKRKDPLHLLCYDLVILRSASLISRQAFNAIGGFDEQLIGYEDDDLFFRIVMAGYEHYFIEHTVTTWCVQENGTSLSIKMRINRVLYIKKTMSSFSQKHFFCKDLYPWFLFIVVKDAIGALKNNSFEQGVAISILQDFIHLCKKNDIHFFHRLRLHYLLIKIQLGSKVLLSAKKVDKKKTVSNLIHSNVSSPDFVPYHSFSPNLLNARQEKNTGLKHNEYAIILHIHYTEVWVNICGYLRKIEDSHPFDLYVTVTSKIAQDLVAKEYPDAHIELVENRGRDILPFIHMLKKIENKNYMAVCKLHSKRSVHLSNGDDTREEMLQSLVGSQDLVNNILSRFRSNPQLGLIAPAKFLLNHNTNNMKVNSLNVYRIADYLQVDFQYSLFPAGSMYWVSPKSLHPLLKINRTFFAAEAGMLDGMNEHAIERLICTLVQNNNYLVESV